MKVYRIHILLLLWLGCLPTLHAQENDKADSLLYAVDVNLNPDQPQYFIPTIENILKNLRYANSQRSKRFAYVENANRLKEDGNIYNYIKVIFEDYISSARNIRPSASRENLAGEITDFIKSYDEFLYIKINSGQLGFIEFQFYRYEILDDDSLSLQIDTLFVPGSREIVSVDRIIDLPVHKYKRSSSIFINLQDDPSTQIVSLRNAVSQVFDETNQVPEVLLTSGGDLYENAYYHAIGDTVELRAEVLDPDSKTEFFSYNWRQISPDTLVPGLVLENNRTIQKFILETKGCYTVSVTVNDGTHDSNEAERTFCVRKKPTISLKSYGRGDRTIISYQSYLLTKEKLFEIDYDQWRHGTIECEYIDPAKLTLELKPVVDERGILQERDSSEREEETLVLVQRMSNKYLAKTTSYYSFYYGSGDLPRFYKELRMYARQPYDFGTFYMLTDAATKGAYRIHLYSQFSSKSTLVPGTYKYQLSLASEGLESESIPFDVEVRKLTPLRFNIGYILSPLLTFARDTLNERRFLRFSAGIGLKISPSIELEAGVSPFSNLDSTNQGALLSYVRCYVNNHIFTQKVNNRAWLKPKLALYAELGFGVRLPADNQANQQYWTFGLAGRTKIIDLNLGYTLSEFFNGPIFSLSVYKLFYKH